MRILTAEERNWSRNIISFNCTHIHVHTHAHTPFSIYSRNICCSCNIPLCKVGYLLRLFYIVLYILWYISALLYNEDGIKNPDLGYLGRLTSNENKVYSLLRNWVSLSLSLSHTHTPLLLAEISFIRFFCILLFTIALFMTVYYTFQTFFFPPVVFVR